MLLYFFVISCTIAALFGLYKYKVNGALWGLPLAMVHGTIASTFAIIKLLVLLKTFLLVASGFLMVLCLIAMGYCYYQYKSKKAPWAKQTSLGFGAVTTLLAVTNLILTFTQPAEDFKAIVDKELRYTEIGMEYLGEYLALNFANSRILLINESLSSENEAVQEAMMTGLKKGLKGKLSILAEEFPTDTLPVDSTKPINPDSNRFILSGHAFNQMLALNPECDLVLSLIGLPSDWQKMHLWRMPSKERPNLVVAFGNVSQFKKEIQKGLISAYLTSQRNQVATKEKSIPSDLKKAFDQRFCLVDKTNVNQISKKFPDLFLNAPLLEILHQATKTTMAGNEW